DEHKKIGGVAKPVIPGGNPIHDIVRNMIQKNRPVGDSTKQVEPKVASLIRQSGVDFHGCRVRLKASAAGGHQSCGPARLSQGDIMNIPSRQMLHQRPENQRFGRGKVCMIPAWFEPLRPRHERSHSFMTARIFKPAKNAMQSGRAQTMEWQLDYEPEQPRIVEPLMGWTSSADMKQQVTLRFETKEEAVAYCEREGIPYQVFEPKESARRQVAYADNFAFRRGEPWTH